MRIIANKSILHNNVTNCTFIATQLDEQVQTGTRENDSHIEWMGDLTIPVVKMTLDDFQCRRTEIISDMLDNSDVHGIYPTTKAFNALDELFTGIVQ